MAEEGRAEGTGRVARVQVEALRTEMTNIRQEQAKLSKNVSKELGGLEELMRELGEEMMEQLQASEREREKRNP
jgi:hypothetical protein